MIVRVHLRVARDRSARDGVRVDATSDHPAEERDA
jgi:hypothetical protein